MRKILCVFFGLWLGAGAAFAAPVTVGDYANAMDEAAARLDVALAERQKAGEAAAAQNLALLAAMIRRASAEFHRAEQTLLTDDAQALPGPVKRRLDAAFALAAQAQDKGDAPGFVDEAQATFNALIDALPINKPHPVIYGLLSSDLAGPQARLPADVVVYGHRLIDPVFNASPTVQFDGRDLPPEAVAAHDDRLEIALPAPVKAAAHFAPPPCESRPSFGLRVRDVYAEAHGLWPLVWHTPVETNADFYVLASPTLYEAQVHAESETLETAAQTVDFRRRSDFVVAECERTLTAQVEAALPPGASDVVCKAVWTDTTGAASATAGCLREGAAVRASGALTGGERACSPDKLCTCPVRAQGFLEVSGSYRVAKAGTGLKPLEGLAPLTFPAGGLARRALAAPAGERLRHVKIDLVRIDPMRRACPTVADRLDFTFGYAPSAAAVSRSGAFRALYRDGVLSVGAAEALAPEVVGKP